MREARRDKRQRLVDAAARLIHRRGLEATTLAQVAEASGVPLGNVYYYYRTKDQLTEAVIDARLEAIEAAIATAETAAGPAERVARLLEVFGEQAAAVTRYGCPFGVLAGELERRGGPLATRGSRLLRRQLDWLAGQYRAMGLTSAGARRQAVALLAAKQGAAQIAQGLRDPGVLRERMRALAAEVRGGREPKRVVAR
ncbi:MAG: helix-turn-helix domain-containing protein [Gemmatimonadales bacterium]|nr:helix-turn-helix domain-containing protein [Gemmatimonadales bacterium]